MTAAVEPTLPDDAIEAAARAMHEAQNPPVMITRESARIANARRPNEPERRIIRIALAAAYPVLRAHIEAERMPLMQRIDSLLSLIYYRENAYLNEQTHHELRELLVDVAKITRARVARGEQ